ncbi:hypothetical protein BHM03_00050088 [Ensete ventricosum]|nr:hypothetical protein BHM03_00050088 [Ensete ventricosum]
MILPLENQDISLLDICPVGATFLFVFFPLEVSETTIPFGLLCFAEQLVSCSAPANALARLRLFANIVPIALFKVCNLDLYRPVRAVHIGPPRYRYADRPLPGGSVKNRPSTVDFGRRWPILKEIDRRRSIEEEKGKKKRKRKKKKKRGRKNTSLAFVLARLPSRPAGRLRAVVARWTPAAAFSPARGDATRGRRPWSLFLPREETERLPA